MKKLLEAMYDELLAPKKKKRRGKMTLEKERLILCRWEDREAENL